MSKEFRFRYIWNDKKKRELYGIDLQYRTYGGEWITDRMFLVNNDCVNLAMIDDIDYLLQLGYKPSETVNTSVSEMR